MHLLDRSLIDNSTLLLNKRNLYKYDIIIIIIKGPADDFGPRPRSP